MGLRRDRYETLESEFPDLLPCGFGGAAFNLSADVHGRELTCQLFEALNFFVVPWGAFCFSHC